MDAFSLGQYLREAREEKSITIEQAETTLKIRRHILEGFENGNFNLIDASPVQIRGFIRNYARFLDLDEDVVIQYFESSQQPTARKSTRRPPSKTQIPRPPDKRETDTHPTITPTGRPKRRQARGIGLLRIFLFLLIGGVAITVIGFVFTQLLDINISSESTPVAINDDNSDGSETLPTLTPTPPITPTTESNSTLIPRGDQNYLGQPVLVTIEFIQRTWIQVTADNEEVFSGIVRPNELILEYPANNSLIVSASNAEALLVTYNGQPQPPYGIRGQSIEIVFQPENDIRVSALGSVALAVTPTATRILPVLEITPVVDDPEAITTLSNTLEPTPLPLVPGQATAEDQSNATTEVPNPTATPDTNTIPTLETGDTPDVTAEVTVESSNTMTPTEIILQPTGTPTPDVALPPRITPTASTPQK